MRWNPNDDGIDFNPRMRTSSYSCKGAVHICTRPSTTASTRLCAASNPTRRTAHRASYTQDRAKCQQPQVPIYA